MIDLKFDISYVSKFPLLGDSPKITIIGDNSIVETFEVEFVDLETNEILSVKKCKINETVTGDRQWFTKWIIRVYDSKKNLLHYDIFSLERKAVFIKIDAYALGDNIAWIPYVDEFRKKHNCNVICSTFHNNLFEKEYPYILFAAPNTQISNVYAQYYIGANTTINPKYCPVVSTNVPLQMVVTETLGLKYNEIVAKISSNDFVPNYGGKYACISEHASHPMKEWKINGGWQFVVDFLNSVGYKVVVISKESTNLKNIIDKTGDISLPDRIQDLKYSSFFIGVSSGLSWVAWALKKHVVMISDVTPCFHEFQTNITRIGGKTLDTIDYENQTISSVKDVISALKIII